ncbi:sigma 54-interacting transcriptional regulator [Aegicerativicinus sediminis]|uniref:sigma 54-interacting transcriptional regulator n=1 Tax=Aegicerativicinus sediminis TaxID=2893202 RepID=UPI001E3C156A|nr:sigma 54-interacting transcriptional regulator [Aegicerativicinus sediminis]
MIELKPEEIADFLSNIPFFTEVEQSSLIEVANKLETNSCYGNQSIFKKGDPGDSFYIIHSGTIKVHDGDHIFNTLKEGDCFGEYTLIDEGVRSADVTTLDRAILFQLKKSEFLKLMSKDPGLAKGILAVMIKRHRDVDDFQNKLAKSKKEIEVTNAKLQGVLDGAMDGIIMYDSNFRIIVGNQAACSMFDNSDIIQRNILFFFDEDSADIVEKYTRRLIDLDKNICHSYIPKILKILDSQNNISYNEGTISRWKTEEMDCFTLVLRNIEERLKAENKIVDLTEKSDYLEEEVKELTQHFGIIAEHPKMIEAINSVKKVAATGATVLIHGETGTGKELIARAIHQQSSRADKIMVKLNCGAIPGNLIESELFGHEKGAFTGATSARKGRFLLADKGTLFLDEIGELPIELQSKLLRILQEGEFEPVGSSTTIKVDVRIIAATHKDLYKESKEGKFREDLYYRLNVFPISVPPLRERGDDINLIAQEMLNHYTDKFSKPKITLDNDTKTLFLAYKWPGNVRELQNLMERAAIIADNGFVNWSQLLPTSELDPIGESKAPIKILTIKELQQIEKENILKALRQTKWKISGKHGAAELLGLPSTTLASKIKTLGIERPI